MNFQLFPYGNARTSGPVGGLYQFSCQHGTNECIANMYQACAISHFNTTTDNVPAWWPMVQCMESSRSPATAAQSCATNAGLDWSVIDTCAGSDPAVGTAADGNPLMYSVGQATNNLVPAHQWTPWVTLNGKPLSSSDLDKSLVSLVCAAYTGPSPPGCNAKKIQLDYLVDEQ